MACRTTSIYARAMAILDSQIRINIYDIDVDVHTRHCCKLCGCKYGNDDHCTVMITNYVGLTGKCESCYEYRYRGDR